MVPDPDLIEAWMHLMVSGMVLMALELMELADCQLSMEIKEALMAVESPFVEEHPEEMLLDWIELAGCQLSSEVKNIWLAASFAMKHPQRNGLVN